MKFVLGIDSGGTKYLVRAQDLDGKNLAKLQGPPAAHHHMTMEQATLRINENIDACLAKFHGKREDCVYLVCGTTGIDHPEDAEALTELYKGLQGFTCPMLCLNDAVVAHHAVSNGVGALVISGTGSIAYGRNANGEEVRCGGWPPVIFGDEGSGTWISMQALRHLSMVMDGRLDKTLLSEKIVEMLGITQGEELVRVCIEIEKKQWRNPGLAIVVDEAAEAGDPYATEILQEAARCTKAMAEHVIKSLRLDVEKEFIVGAWGSAIAKSPLHLAYFTREILADFPGAIVRVSHKDAAEGACSMALEYYRQGIHE